MFLSCTSKESDDYMYNAKDSKSVYVFTNYVSVSLLFSHSSLVARIMYMVGD